MLNRSLFVWWLGLAWLVVLSPLRGQDQDPATTRLGSFLGDDQEVTIAKVQAAQEQLPKLTELDEAARTRISEALQAALKSLESAQQATTKTADFERLTQTLNQQLSAAANQLAQLSEEKTAVDTSLTTDQLRQLVNQYQIDLDNARRQLATAEAEPERQRQRLADIPTRNAERQAELDALNQQLAAPARGGDTPAFNTARAMQLVAQRQLIEQEQKRAAAEQAWYMAAVNLLPEQTKVAAQQVRVAESRWKAAQALLQRRQENDAQRIRRETREEAAAAPPAFEPLAKGNEALAELYISQLDQNTRLEKQWRDANELLGNIRQRFETTTDRVKSVGLTDAMGVHLKEVRQELVRRRANNRPDPKLKDEMSRLRVDSFKRQDELSEWTTVEDAVETAFNRAGSLAEAGQVGDGPRESVTKLVSRRHQLNQELVALNNRLLDNFVNLDIAQHELQKQIDSFITFIDENIIWIPSCLPLQWSDVTASGEAALWLFGMENWNGLWARIGQGLLARPVTLAGFAISLALLFGLHGRFRKLVLESSEEAMRGRCTTMLPTWNALLATLLMAARWPMIFAFLGWVLRSAMPSDEFSMAWGQAMLSVALMIAPFEMLRLACRQKGLAAAHFDWTDSIRVFFQRHLRWIYLLAVPSVCVMVALENQGQDSWADSLGRLAAISLFAVATWFLHLALKPDGPVFRQLAIGGSNSLIYRWRTAIYLAVAAIPITLMVLAISGYYYTAFQLAGCLERSAVLVVVLIIAGGLAFRWLLIRRRAIAIEELRKLRAQQLAAGGSPGGGDAESKAAIEIQDAPALDLASVSQQAKEVVVFLLGVCGVITLWWIWQDVLPAIGMLRRVELWHSAVGNDVVPVTLQDVVYSLAIVVVTLLLIRNLSGLLNLVFLNYFRLDSGARFAAMTLIRYMIMILGAVMALGFLKIAWSQYGWLVAAASVGLGFGLQEVFANFVSGLILLFERPVRVGDIVTVDGQTGVVSKIQMRATTITNWDYQEFVVPNKNLITGTLLNWTLSNGTSRIVIEVGVGYESDPNRVQSILLDVVSSHPDIIAEPVPSAYFEKFGDSALIFIIRCFTNQFDHRIRIKHELHGLILDRLSAAGIKIPFPQRDIHMITPT